MPAPLDPTKRAAIAADIRAGTHGRNAIARKHDVSASTVGKIADAEGITGAFDRASTERATTARLADLGAWRAGFAERMAARAEWCNAQIDEQAVVGVQKGPDGPEVLYGPRPARDVQHLMVAAGIAVDKVGVLTRDDGGAERDAGALIAGLVDGLRSRAEEPAP